MNTTVHIFLNVQVAERKEITDLENSFKNFGCVHQAQDKQSPKPWNEPWLRNSTEKDSWTWSLRKLIIYDTNIVHQGFALCSSLGRVSIS